MMQVFVFHYVCMVTSIGDTGHRTPSVYQVLKFPGLPVPKVWLIFCHGVKRSSDLGQLVRNVSRGTDNRPADLGVFETFRFRVMGKHASD